MLAKPGLDGHDRGIKVVAMALRDAGAEVIYLGLRRSPAEIVRAASEDDADVIGVSILSGAHLELSKELLAERSAQRLDDVPIVVGGTIPAVDADELRHAGIAAVLSVGTRLDEAVATVLSLAKARP